MALPSYDELVGEEALPSYEELTTPTTTSKPATIRSEGQGPEPRETFLDKMKRVAEQRVVEPVEKFLFSPEAAQATRETLSGLVPQSFGQAGEMAAGMFAPEVQGIRDIYRAGKVLTGTPVEEAIPESQRLAELEETPPYSVERFRAGIGIPIELGMAALVGKGAFPREPLPPLPAKIEALREAQLRAAVKGPEEAPSAPEVATVPTTEYAAPAAEAAAPQPEMVRLYRVEPETKAEVDWLKKHMPPERFEQFMSERGRGFAETPREEYGHGAEGYRTFYVDVPREVAQASMRMNTASGKPFPEYVLPPEFVSKKQPIGGEYATKEGQVEGGVSVERPRDDTRGAPAETGGGGGVQPTAKIEEAVPGGGGAPEAEAAVAPPEAPLVKVKHDEHAKPGYTAVPTEDLPYAGGEPPVTPPVSEPVPGAPQKPSKIGKSIEAKAVEAKLTQGFAETAGYDPITIADQAARADAAIKASPVQARAMIRGEAPLPEGLRGTALITAMEEHLLKHPNAQVAYEMANSPLTSATSAAAQEMRLMSERVPDSLTAKFAEIKAARAEGAKLRGETSAKVAKDITKEVVRTASKRPTWEAFVREIVC